MAAAGVLEKREVMYTVNQSWLVYLALVIVATSTPGPAVLFLMDNTTLHGWKKVVFSPGVAHCKTRAIVFLTALFPPFLLVEQPLIPHFTMLIATLTFFSFAFLMRYALLARKEKLRLMKPNRMKTYGRASGSYFFRSWCRAGNLLQPPKIGGQDRGDRYAAFRLKTGRLDLEIPETVHISFPISLHDQNVV